ncbi:hypothetical protein, partial [Methylobacterium sp. WL18]|uniref:hypothetical protein n=1 Tax=Methylobacterium sp. WL18 TaxID=2603897 RepID=UPI001AEEFA2B
DGLRGGVAARIDRRPRAVFRRSRPARTPQASLMKRLILIGIFVALFAGIIAIAGRWSMVTPVNPAVAPDTSATPNPTGQRK